jgi:hypothetical protein
VVPDEEGLGDIENEEVGRPFVGQVTDVAPDLAERLAEEKVG